MNKLKTAERTSVVSALIEGNSIRATVRMTGIAKNTITKLLLDLGAACERFHDVAVRNLTCKRIQVDEIWSFVGCKANHVPRERQFDPTIGDIWTWTAICADTKIVPAWFVGHRDADCGRAFIYDLSLRLANRVQLTSDGHRPYLLAVPEAFGNDIDYAMLVKIYGSDKTEKGPERKYSPGKINGSKRNAVIGNPDPEHVSTSFAERNNLTMRMSMRRFTRLTNAFSKKLRNHECAIALHFAHYNFCRVHSTLKTAPAVAAGLISQPMTVQELVKLMD